jgi:uncharacterized membrane protein YphA (DoxX/SURF4 family)
MATVKKLLSSQMLYLAIKLVLAGIFIYAGFIKIVDPKSFARIISQYGLIPEYLLPVIAIGLPALELIAGAGLIFDVKGSLSVISAMLISFIFILFFGIMRDLNVDCGCFSQEEIDGQNSLKRALYRDMIMVGGVAYMYGYRRISHKKT